MCYRDSQQKYVNLYQMKLELLQKGQKLSVLDFDLYAFMYGSTHHAFHEFTLSEVCFFQIVSKDILQELENMDKECDIDDILNYRTIAEQQLQLLRIALMADASSAACCPVSCCRSATPALPPTVAWLLSVLLATTCLQLAAMVCMHRVPSDDATAGCELYHEG
ncbi:hypothetical protein PR202_gb28978 [Eleusine coracana subsp. coracana]|uniref:Uncharacterized protein n=1 Tax=Eleusine coracana subsp. coracana TaxID=191504 RepID=A0AAV5FYH4_ELECO|nr:hypothetical protein PR202_gb28978 [Eleusine coracana subsp. coracana]